MKRFVFFCAAAVTCCLTACNQSADTKDADIKAVQANEVQWNQDWLSKDSNKIAGHYVDRGMLVLAPVRIGESALLAAEVGVGPGGNLTAFTAFGLDANDRHKLMDQNLELMRTAWSGGALPGGDKLYPSSPTPVDRIWQATFTVPGAKRAGLAGDGLMLSRTQPRPPENPTASLSDIQNPMLDAYLEALPKGREPRILASRTVFVADDRKEAMRFAEIGLSRLRHRLAATGNLSSGNLVGDLITAMDVHIGTPDEVIESLFADSTLRLPTPSSVPVCESASARANAFAIIPVPRMPHVSLAIDVLLLTCAIVLPKLSSETQNLILSCRKTANQNAACSKYGQFCYFS